MTVQFFSKLSENYIRLLDDDQYYDVTIEVGEDPNVKIFRAHTIILCYRSPYLQRTLASKKASKDNALVHINLPNISPELFQNILKYIYGDFLQSVHPYKKLLKHQLYEDLLQSHLNPNSEQNDSILLPRNIRIEGIIDTKINKHANDAIISNIEYLSCALYNGSKDGPHFGEDLIIYSYRREFEDYSHRYCRKNYYEKKIRDSEDLFSIEDYEVFQITK
ncbi:BTB/POZ protein [Rhizophagus irregularis DAOM 181602=DAOM 197198]|nr:BTB/POZ protein [Rhizophagus irregularis DAOM 181602=DAOM 197198]